MSKEVPTPDEAADIYVTMREAAAYLQGIAVEMTHGEEDAGAEIKRHLTYAEAIMKGVKIVRRLTELLGETQQELLQAKHDLDGAEAHLAEQRQLLAAATEGGLGAIYEERQRQINDLRYASEGDLRWKNGELVKAAAAYALHGRTPKTSAVNCNALWPFDEEDFRPDSLKRNLERAGALIAAEIDRLELQEKIDAQQA